MNVDKRKAGIVAAGLVILGGLFVLTVSPSTIQRGLNSRTRGTGRQARQAARANRIPTETVCRRRKCPSLFSPPTTFEAVPQPPLASLKPVLHGLVDRDGPPSAGFAGVAVRGFVVKAFWSDLQPAEGGDIAPNNVIDQALAQVAALNAHTPGIGIKVRLYGGVYAPAWAKALGGAPVQVTNPQSGQSATIGRFWTSAYGAAYDDLERKLAARYDGVADLREIVISRCTTFFAEPFIRDKGDKQTVANLFDAGYSTAADHVCHQEQIQAHQVWQHTRSDLELNPYQDIERKGAASVDEAFTESMMQYCRAVLGPRCVLENNSLAEPLKYPQMYGAMRQLGAPIAFQTATANKVGNLSGALDFAVAEGANSVELPTSYTDQPPQQYADANNRLAANPD
jgi:hypothetical protein